jgi:serine/threonine-protein kinase
MVMDLLVGETFAARLAREGALPLPEVARIMVDVCSALGCAHALGIVHRDLKPENIFLARSPTGATEVKVLDFGIAKLTAADGDAAQTGTTTATGAVLGTPYYMAPEQLFGEKDVDHRADIWALGIILYEALAGVRPTQGANMGQVYKLVTTGIPLISERTAHLPTTVVNLVSRMLARDKALRPDGVREVLATLSEYTSDAGMRDVRVGSPLPRGFFSRDRFRMALWPGSVAAAILFAGVLTWRVRDREASKIRAPEMGAAVDVAPASQIAVSAQPAEVTQETAPMSSDTPAPSSSNAAGAASKARQPPSRSVPKALASKRPECSQPFTLDADGNKVFKTECFSR